MNIELIWTNHRTNQENRTMYFVSRGTDLQCVGSIEYSFSDYY